MNLDPLLRFIHIAGVVVWVGGMFFAYVCLRPTAVAVLEPPQRLQLWQGVFARFFVWVWIAVALIATSGLWMFGRYGLAAAPPNLHLMMGSGFAMIAIYIYVATVPYPALTRAVAAGNWPAGGAALNRIRQMVAINLTLGVLTIGIATLGRYLA